METKICITCNIEKNIDNFRKSGKYIRNDCKECENKKCKVRNKLNQEHIKEKQKQYREKNKEKIRRYRKEHYNKDKQKEYNKNYYKENKEYYKNWHKQYYAENKIKLRKKKIEWEKENKEKRKVYREKDYFKRQSDPVLKLKGQVRNMLCNSFKKRGLIKSKKLEEIAGCSMDFLINYLYKTFKDNYGYDWDEKEPVHIDHKIPLFIANTEEEVIKLCNYSNLQLLKAKDNLQKNKNLDWVLTK